jgi:hypothetical protein
MCPTPDAQFFAMHDMRTVSLAAGGEMRDYELVAYIAKDATGTRGACHVRPSFWLPR